MKRLPALAAALVVLAPSVIVVPTATASHADTQTYSGVVATPNEGLDVLRAGPDHADYPVSVGPGVIAIEAHSVGAQVLDSPQTEFGPLWFGWISLVIFDPSGVERAGSGWHTGPDHDASVDWDDIDEGGPGTWTVRIECIECTPYSYTLAVSRRFAENGVNLTAAETLGTAVPGGSFSTTFMLTNTGEQTETFDLTVENLPEGWTAFFPATITAASGESLPATFSVDVPNGALADPVSISLTATRGGASDRVDFGISLDETTIELRTLSSVVVAVVEFTGVNAYHEEFRNPLARLDPEWYVSNYPRDAEALPLTLDAQSYKAAREKDSALIGSIRGGQLYYIPGTKVIGAICFPVGSACGSSLMDEGGHSTGTSSLATGNTLGRAPGAYIVSVSGDFFQGYRWAARQSWIDVISISVGLFIGPYVVNPACDFGVSCELPEYFNAGVGNPYVPFSSLGSAKIAFDSGKRVFTGNAAGGGVGSNVLGAGSALPGQTYFSSVAGTPWSVTVGQYMPWSEQPPFDNAVPVEVSAQAWDLVAASPSSLAGTNSFGHSSGATPVAAGYYAVVVMRGREILGDTREGGGAELATWNGVEPLPAVGRLADGVMTVDDATGIYYHSAEQVDYLEAEAEHGTDPRWGENMMPVPPGLEFAHEGYGLLSDDTRDASFGMLDGSITEPDRTVDDVLEAASLAARFAFWEPHARFGIWVF